MSEHVKNFIDKYHNVTWEHAPSRKGDVKNTTADISALVKLGWQPTIKIEDGLARSFA